MFPLECSFDSTPIFELPDLFTEDLGFLETSIDPVPQNPKKRQRKSSNINSEEKKDDEETNEPKAKKIMHRNIERQRRQEMNKLYNSLRSLLPLEYIKGKRSVSDHMHEAVNYIRHMDNKLKELKMRKDELSKSCCSLIESSQNRKSSNNIPVNPQNSVTVSPCLDGLEILITVGLDGEENIFLSKICKLLIETGINVISCVSTKANERLLYRIQSQDNGLAHINMPVLQQRLAHVINAG